jgi:hypothetical protein
MTMQQWPSRLAALLILLAIPCIASTVCFFSWMQWQKGQIEFAEQLEQYDRLRAIAEYPIDGLASQNQSAPTSELILGSGAQPVLAAGLQAKIRTLGESNSLQVVQTSDLPTEKLNESFSRLGIRAELAGPLSNLQTLLSELEQSKPWLFVDNVQLRSGFADSSPQATEPLSYLGMDVWGIVVMDTQKPEVP